MNKNYYLCIHARMCVRAYMDREQAIIRIGELRSILRENARKYYVDNAPTMSDQDYDFLMHELEGLEEAFPDLITPDSPTRKVGSDIDDPFGANAELGIKNDFAKVAHKYPMLSLANTYSISEVEDFAARASKSSGSDFTWCCELKFDGTAICLTYRNGELFRALTRGDGVVGDDVTENALRISNIPKRLKGSGYPEEFEIRGEVLMPFSSFEKLNADREEIGEMPFANPRNAASGSLKLQNPEEVALRGLMCTLYHIPGEHPSFRTHDQALRSAASWGLPVSDVRKVCKDISEIEDFISYWDSARRNLPFATDGIVIKINELGIQKELGYTAKSPRWAVAYKYKAEQALTELLSIDYQVGRTGAVTPVANLSPVQLSGTVVKRATLNNEGWMDQLDIHEHDYVYVEKGGEIIPKITSVELSRRLPGASKPEFPRTCPDCGTPLVKPEGEARWFCPNSDLCPTQNKARLVHFLSRKAMNVIAGDATVDQLYNLGLVRSVADFYDLKPLELISLEGWQERAVERFLESLDASRKVPFSRVLYALGIRYVGERTAKDIARHFGSIEAIQAAGIDQLLEVPEVGEVIAESLYSYFRDPFHIEEISRLKAAGLQFSEERRVEKLSDALEGKTVVISGNFSVSRDEIKSLIERNGGKNSSSVSGKTDFLLAGEKPGPEKIKKAAELGVKVISEEEFRSMLPSPAGEETHPSENGIQLSLF